MFYNNYEQSACSVASDSATLRTIGRQDPLSMGFSRQEYWSGLPFPPSGDRPNPRMELASPTSNALKGLLYPLSYWERSHKRSMLLPLSRFSRVRLCVTPEMAAHQAPPSLGFSRQKHWSGLPFPSPMHESEVAQSCPTLCDPPGLQPTRLLSPRDFPGNTTGVGCHCLLHCGFIPFSKFGKNLSSLQILLRSHSFSLFFEDLLIHGFGCWKFFYISLILQIFFSNLFIHFVSFWILVNFPCSQQCPISH